MNEFAYRMILNLLPENRDNKNAIFMITCENGQNNYFDNVVGGGWKITRINGIDGVESSFTGEGNTVIVFGSDNKFINCKIELQKNDTVILCHSVNMIRNLRISSLREGTLTWIGENFSSSQVHLNLKEKRKIVIGNDCMFSNGINILNSDMHAVLDETGNCINYGEDVVIGNHVWIGQNVEILKGTVIQDNSIVGAGSVVTSKFSKKNVCIAGNPARVIKENVNWDRRSPENFSNGGCHK